MSLFYIAIGLAAGVLAGLFGIGGGVLIVPALAIIGNMPIKMATGTSLGVFLLPVGILGAMTYWKDGNLDFKVSALVALGLVFGAWTGSKLAQQMTPHTLQRLFAVFLLVMAVRMWVKA